MVHHPKRRGMIRRHVNLMLAFALFLCCAACIVGYSSFKILMHSSSSSQVPCPSCVCDCHSEATLFFPSDKYADCSTKNDPDVREEMEKDMADLVVEEIALLRTVANETLEHKRELTMAARRSASRYQNEAQQCNAGVTACEEAREMAERELVKELKLSAMWENRARESGWRPHN